MNESKRQQKFSKLILKDISDIILKDKMGVFTNTFVTVAEVKMSPDLSVAKIFLSMLLVKDKDAMLSRINDRKGEIRRELGLKIGKQVRIVPQLVFIVDDIEENASKIDKIIDNLDIPESDDEGND